MPVCYTLVLETKRKGTTSCVEKLMENVSNRIANKQLVFPGIYSLTKTLVSALHAYDLCFSSSIYNTLHALEILAISLVSMRL